MARLRYNGRNHNAVLRNPPTAWALRTKAGRLIGGPPPKAATGQKGARRVLIRSGPGQKKSLLARRRRDMGATAGRGPITGRVSALRPPAPRR